MGRASSMVVSAAVSAALLVTGCAIFAGKADYADYRQVRLAEDERQRALAMARYVEAHPDGAWAEEIEKKRADDEPLLYESAKSTRDGLRFYLEAYPEGQFTSQARSRLEALETVEGHREEEQEAEREVKREHREELVQRRRNWATRAVGFWVKTLLGIGNWGEPIPSVAQNNPEFNKAFGKNPRPHCSRRECIKFYQLQYGIPVPGRTRIDRTIRLLLRLRLEEGKLTRAEILMPDRGFSRWFELQEETLVTDEDPTQRNEAINWAADKLAPIVQKFTSGAESFDIVPEPVDPPRVRRPDQPDPGASQLPGARGEQQPSQQDGEDDGDDEAQAASDGDDGDENKDEMDELLEQAAGGDEQGQDEEASQEPEPETLHLPIAVQGFRTDALEIGVFAASPDDEGPAYDGLFIELSGGDGDG